MIREEQIRYEAWKYSCEIENRSHDGRPDWEDHRWAFESGAAWADANTQWHNPKKGELPEDEELYLAIRGGFFILLQWNPQEQCWDDEYGDDFVCKPDGVECWTELPHPPKFD